MNTNYALNQVEQLKSNVSEDERVYIKLINRNIEDMLSDSPKSQLGLDLEVWALWLNKQIYFRHLDFKKLNKYKFSVSKIVDIDFEIAVKYWMSDMGVTTSFHYIDQLYRYFLKFLKMSKGFTLSTNDLAEAFRVESERIQFETANSICSFIDYFPEIDAEKKYKDFLKAILKKYSSFQRDDIQRDLPPTKEVYLFDWIVKDYFKKLSYSSEDFKIFFPIYLWWEFSVIIPLRPVEFCGLAKDALIKEGGNYILKLPREKNRKSRVQIIDSIPIPEYLGEAIESYSIQTADSSVETLLNPLIGFTKENRSISFYSNQRHNYLISIFYSEVVCKKYDYSVDFGNVNNPIQDGIENDNKFDITHPITTGDTRHFAMLNLMRQGYNPLEIARLAGHTVLASQDGYYSHLNYWVDVEVLKLTEEIARKFNGDYNSYIDSEFKQKHVLTNDFSDIEYIQLDYGICLDLQQNCPVDNCTDCNSWRIDFETFKNEYRKLDKLMKDKKLEINQALAVLINLQKHFFDKKHEKDYVYTRDLKEVSKNLDFILRKYTTYKFNIGNARRH